MTIQVFICIYSLLVHQVLDRVLSDLALVYNILISKLACGINYLYIKHNERYKFLPFIFTLIFANFYGLGCFSPLFINP